MTVWRRVSRRDPPVRRTASSTSAGSCCAGTARRSASSRRSFDVLAYLAAAPWQVVRKEELLDEVWGDRFVSESALTTRIKSARQAVGDDGSRQTIIRTVHGKGYEFIAAVEVEDRPHRDAAAVRRAAAPMPLPAAVQPLIGREELLDVGWSSRRRTTGWSPWSAPAGSARPSVGFELARAVAGRLRRRRPRRRARDRSSTRTRPPRRSPPRSTSTAPPAARSTTPSSSSSGRSGACCSSTTASTSIEPVADPGQPRPPGGARGVDRRHQPGAAGRGRRARVDGRAALDHGRASSGPTDDRRSRPSRCSSSGPAPSIPRFVLDAATAPAVVEICRRLDGIPLAIELAAARARAIDVAEIARRLDERFRLLKACVAAATPATGRSTTPSAGRTTCSTATSRSCSRRWRCSPASSTSAAEAICAAGDVLDLLTRLTERSMLAVRRRPRVGTRYELLETLREYGRTRLDDERARAAVRGPCRALRGGGRGRSSSAADAATSARACAGRRLVRRPAGRPALRAAGRRPRHRLPADRLDPRVRHAQRCATRCSPGPTPPRAPGPRTDPLLAPLVTGVRAYGAWVRGEFDLGRALAHGPARPRPARRRRRRDWSSGCWPTCCLVGQVEQGHGGGGATAGARRGVGRIAHGWPRLLHGVGRAAAPSATTTRRAARSPGPTRSAQTTGSPTDLASASVAEGFASHDDDHAALEAFATADRLAGAAGNRWMSAFARTEASGLLVHHGDVAAGLPRPRRRWSTSGHRAGEWSQQWHTLSRCVIALDRIGQDEHGRGGGRRHRGPGDDRAARR